MLIIRIAGIVSLLLLICLCAFLCKEEKHLQSQRNEDSNRRKKAIWLRLSLKHGVKASAPITLLLMILLCVLGITTKTRLPDIWDLPCLFFMVIFATTALLFLGGPPET